MTATAHIAASAAIGRSPLPLWAAAPLSFLLHYLLDFLPHVDVADLLDESELWPPTPKAAFLAGVDVGLGLALISPVLSRSARREALKASACILLGLLPDLLENIPTTKRAIERSGLYTKALHLHQRLERAQWARAFGVLDQLVLLLALRRLVERGAGNLTGQPRTRPAGRRA